MAIDCVDCGRSTVDEWYMVHDDLWVAAGMERLGGCLCVRCLERRLGRLLSPDDLAREPVNAPGYQHPETDRLAELKRSAAERRPWPRLWPLFRTPSDVREFIAANAPPGCTCEPLVFWLRTPTGGCEVGLEHRPGCGLAATASRAPR